MTEMNVSVVDAMVAQATSERLRLGDPRVTAFLADLSLRLSRPAVSRDHPELVPLGFFLRRTHLTRLLAGLDGLRVPRGLVFHVPPANVASMLLYPWALSALVGNPNIVRLPSAGTPALAVLRTELDAAIASADPVVGRTQRLVEYGHDDAVTGALSHACRLRVLWGGDQTVTRLRRLPLPPRSRELVFPNRSSAAALSAPAWLAASVETRTAVVTGFYNDAYWHGQAACASPLTICWVGEPDQVAVAADHFVAELAAVVAAREPVDAAAAVEQRVRTYGLAVEGTATSIRFTGTALAMVGLAPGQLLGQWSGTGTFGMLRLAELADLAVLIDERHQTLTHFGFSPAELTDLAGRLGGRGLDRVVPIGEALAFEPIWDGYDLLREFSRPVILRPAASAPDMAAHPTGEHMPGRLVPSLGPASRTALR